LFLVPIKSINIIFYLNDNACQLVFKTQSNANTLNVDVSDFERGIYLFKVISKEGSMVKRVIIE